MRAVTPRLTETNKTRMPTSKETLFDRLINAPAIFDGTHISDYSYTTGILMIIQSGLGA
jgi:hypothetical protein